ncbi:hypothetical protein SAMN04490182_0868 [Pseudomonas cedrina]|uniref:Uncharacterized protein n=2 Tax=Pseudomonas cedrina TaxID=651740 RepID=A0A1V2KG34_PSECE|nr:hypothetical protein [Pseudomonas cedrina]ONH56717.1 hypothetical protein BLL36_04895 [Pseudomonas cedrina subsp. cedrina]SDS15745.1 hypothetical protein SAMN04490182_0868 [Pseudomonas cedrina]
MYSLKALIFDNSWTNINKRNIQVNFATFSAHFFIAFTLVIGLLGFLTIGTDLWDGVIVSHAVSLARPDVYHEWFSEAGLFFTPYIYDAIYLFRSVLGYELLAKIFTVFFLILSAFEAAKIASRYFEIPPRIKFYTGILFYLSPAWVLYYSNIYLMHSLTLFTTLICTRYVLDRKAMTVCLPLLLLAFQQSSNAPLSISLILLSSIFQQTKIKDRLINLSAILFITVGFFALRKLFPTYGLYDTYNEIQLSNILDIRNYLSLIKYFVILYLPSFIAVGMALYYRPDKKILYLLVAIFSGILFNGVAYIAVNKLPSVSEIGLMHGESLRFTFTSTIFSVLLLPAVWQSLAQAPRLRLSALTVILIHACALNIYAHEGKMKEVLFQRGMVNEIKKLSPALPSCAINIQSTGVGTLTNYEYGDIFYRAYGETNQLPLGDSKDPTSDMEKIYRKLPKESYKIKYFIPLQMPKCIVDMSVTTSVATWNFGKTFTQYLSRNNQAIVALTVSKVRNL